MERVKAYLRIAGGVIMVVAATFGVRDFGLPPEVEAGVRAVALLVLTIAGGMQVVQGARQL